MGKSIRALSEGRGGRVTDQDEVIGAIKAVVEQQGERIEAGLARVEKLFERIDGRLDRLDARLHRLEGRVDAVDARLNAAEVKLTDRLDGIAFRLDWIGKVLLNPEELSQMLRGDPPPDIPGRRKGSRPNSERAGTGGGTAPRALAAKARA
jgi:archaellum component FlaC